MSIPQGLIVIGMVINIAFALAAHGTQRTGQWNALHNIIAVLALLILLIVGGFFG